MSRRVFNYPKFRVAWYSTPALPTPSPPPNKPTLQEKKFLAVLGTAEIVGATAITYCMLKYVNVEGLAIFIYLFPMGIALRGLDTLEKAADLKNRKD
jgi:hypothetical protein